MFRVECLVRDTKLAEVLRVLDGKVANLDVRPVVFKEPGKAKPTKAPKSNGKSHPGTLINKVRTVVETYPKGGVFKLRELREKVEEVNQSSVSQSSVFGVLKKLVDKNDLIEKVGTNYRRI